MDMVSSNFLPGDPRLIDQIVYELKSQGIFDQFRKECIADVDTKPAYQNLSQRVEGSVMNFLNKQKFTKDINKNQLREQLRKSISESGFLDSGVERIVDQVVNPKINTVFLPKVEDVVYRFLGIERPNQEDRRQENKANVEDLLPNDLEAVSPESVHDHSGNVSLEKKDEPVEEANDNSFNSSNTKTEDESPPFEPLEENTKFSVHEENSVDSHLSGISGLASHDSTQSNEMQMSNSMDISQDASQNSMNSEGNLSIITSEEDTKMDICEDVTLHIKENNDKIEITKGNGVELCKENNQEIKINDLEEKVSNNRNEVNTESDGNIKNVDEKKDVGIKTDSKRTHKSSRSDKDRKEDKDKKSRSKSESKAKDYKDKLGLKQSSSSKEKREYTNGKDEEKDKMSKREDKERDRNKDKSSSKIKEKSDKVRERPEKPKDKPEKDRDRSDKDKTNKEKDRSGKEKGKLDKDKEKSESEKYKSSKDKDKSEKNKSEKEKHDKDKSVSVKHAKEKSSSSKKDSKEKDKYEDKSLKDKSSSNKDKTLSGNKHKDSSNKDKESSKSSKDREKTKSSSSNSKDRREGDLKSKSSDKSKKSDKEKTLSHDKNSSSSKKDKEKKVTDDHYSLKDKKNDRRSTDRDSNDGSGKMSRNNSFTETYSNSCKDSSKESSEVFSSGGGDSSNSDKLSEDIEDSGNLDLPNVEANVPIKYIKPKFASNIHEAMKLMKIRKQLAILERKNQLALTHVPVVNVNNTELNIPQSVTGEKCGSTERPSVILPKQINTEKVTLSTPSKKNGKTIVELQMRLKRHMATSTCVVEDTPVLKSQDLSMESFEALEARLAQEMSNVNDHMYGDEDDYYEYSSITISPIKKRKILEEPKITPNICEAQRNWEGITESTKENCDKLSYEQDHLKSSSDLKRLETDQEVAEYNIDLVNNRSKKNVCDSNRERLVVEKKSCESIKDKYTTIENSITVNNGNNVENEQLAINDAQEVTQIGNESEFISNITDATQPREIVEEEFFQRFDVANEFRGFTVTDENSSSLNNLKELINKLSQDVNRKKKEFYYATHNIGSETHEEQHDISDSSMKVKHITSLQDLLQNNGKKLFIKIDKLNVKLTSKVLVTLQEVGLNEVKNQAKGEVFSAVKEDTVNGTKKTLLSNQEANVMQNEPTIKDRSPNNTSVIVNPNVPVDENQIIDSIVKRQEDDGPCYYLDKFDTVSETHLSVLNEMIVRLEKSIAEQSLKIQNNIPKPKKRGRKRKAHSTENNNSIGCDYKPERKRKLLSDANANQNRDNLCNTDVSSHHSFSLPLSPAESDKSEERKKEDAITVKPKRTGRGSSNKRYSSEDLYKPRPILSSSSSRRRSGRFDDSRT